MDIEQFKLMMEAVSAAGEGAFWVAILWILKGYFITAMVVPVAGVVIIKAANLLRGASDNEVRIEAIREALDIRGRGFVDSDEFRRMMAKIERLKELK